MSVHLALRALIEELYAELPDYPWSSEADRWAELLFCLLQHCGQEPSEVTRRGIAVMRELDLVETGRLADMKGWPEPSDDAVLVAAVLESLGYDRQSAETAVRLLTEAAKAIQNSYQGKVQKFLRKHGNAMAEELVTTFSGLDVPPERLRFAVSHWLQNAVSLPVSLELPSVRSFCQRHDVSVGDLLAAADDLDLNVALVDDLIELDRQIGGAEDGHS